MFDFLLDLIFPRFCLGCGKMGEYFCPRCKKTIRFYSNSISSNYHCPKNLDGIFVLAHYDGIIRKAIKEVKYRGKHAIFSEIAEMFPRKLNFDFDFLVPVPLSRERLLKRGFNQSEILARELGSVLGIKYYGELLIRTRDTKPQFDLKQGDRLKNVQNAFAIAHNTHPIIHNTSVCLVDDVATTGATLSECAKVLKKAGAKKVWAICLARGG